MNKYFVFAAILAGLFSQNHCMETPENSFEGSASPYICTPLAATSDHTQTYSPIHFADVRRKLFFDNSSPELSPIPSLGSPRSNESGEISFLSFDDRHASISSPAFSPVVTYEEEQTSYHTPDISHITLMHIEQMSDYSKNAQEWAMKHLAPDNANKYENMVKALLADKISERLLRDQEFILLNECAPAQLTRHHNEANERFLRACLGHIPAVKRLAEILAQGPRFFSLAHTPAAIRFSQAIAYNYNNKENEFRVSSEVSKSPVRLWQVRNNNKESAIFTLLKTFR